MAPEVPEPLHRPHGGSSLPKWLEWTTALSALVISVCSIGIAFYNAGIESRMLKASSYPYLIIGVSDGVLDGSNGVERFSVELVNHGVGPADERSLTMRVGGRYAADVTELIRAAVGPAEADEAVRLLVPVYDNELTRFIASKDRGLVFHIDKTPQNARYWDLFDEGVRSKGLDPDVCYCSVFDQCWTVHRRVHTPAKACVRSDHEFIPNRRRAASPLPTS
ncbi:hypothetical protein [Phenylobacterium sp.]|jgi:hypothetical protein|uniref:hypothetical protein n=1 Tax=Phenylobacterium sp. TaxID=1871053 RepID=UPI002F40D159